MDCELADKGFDMADTISLKELAFKIIIIKDNCYRIRIGDVYVYFDKDNGYRIKDEIPKMNAYTTYTYETIDKSKNNYSLDKVYEVNGRQGIAYHDNAIYMICDDGDADNDEPDHLYKITVNDNNETCITEVEHAFNEVIKQGEIEGLNIDEDKNQFLLLYNRGARIVLGMPKGFYEGYTEEIHEVYVFNIE